MTRSLLTEIEVDDVAAVERHRKRSSSSSRSNAATTLRETFGVGPIVACMLFGYSGDPTRFATASGVLTAR